MSIRQVIYTSLATEDFDKSVLADILLVAREENENHSITGLLVYHKDQFLQVIEGGEKEIAQLLTNLNKDKRHSNVTVFLDRKIQQREFAGWYMGFKTVKDAGRVTFDYLDLHDFSTENPSKALTFLRGFLEW